MKRTRRSIVLGLCVLAVVLLGRPLFRKWQNREPVQVGKSLDWIEQTAQKLRQVPPPKSQLGAGAPDAPWVVPGYFVFTNGWAAYDFHSVHAMDGLGDLAMLRLSDGRLYFSKLHYCMGITDMMQPSGPEPLPQPADGDDFLTGVGRFQQWTLLSSEHGLLGAVVCLDAARPTRKAKSLWVSIRDANQSEGGSLFKGRYAFSAYFLSWTTRWDSDEVLTIVVFDNNQSPMLTSGDEFQRPTNHLRTLRFSRDKRTSRFTEVKL